MSFSVMLRGAEKLVPAEYWCLYGTCAYMNMNIFLLKNCCTCIHRRIMRLHIFCVKVLYFLRKLYTYTCMYND